MSECRDCDHWEFEEEDKVGGRWGACKSDGVAKHVTVLDQSEALYRDSFGCRFFESDADTADSMADSSRQP
jgi:hypothetical protein